MNKIFKIDLNHLKNKTLNLSREIEYSFGLRGTGVAIIKNIPGYTNLREKVLKSGYELSQQPPEVLNLLKRPSSDYTIGYDDTIFITENSNVNKMFTSFCARSLRDSIVYPKRPDLEMGHKNVWPNDPIFKENFIALGKAISQATTAMLYHVSQYASEKVPGLGNKLWEDFEHDHDLYSRLITYHPPENFQNVFDERVWDGFHNDYGLLTSITHPLYVSKKGELLDIQETGLRVISRNGETLIPKLESDELLVLPSNSIFVLTAGEIPSTLHQVYVDDSLPLNLFRINLANFYYPNYNYAMKIPGDLSYEEIMKKNIKNTYYDKTPFTKGQDFCEYFNSSLNYLMGKNLENNNS